MVSHQAWAGVNITGDDAVLTVGGSSFSMFDDQTKVEDLEHDGSPLYMER